MCHQKVIHYGCKHYDVFPSKDTVYPCDLASAKVFPNRHCWREGKRWFNVKKKSSSCSRCERHYDVDNKDNQVLPTSTSRRCRRLSLTTVPYFDLEWTVDLLPEYVYDDMEESDSDTDSEIILTPSVSEDGEYHTIGTIPTGVLDVDGDDEERVF